MTGLIMDNPLLVPVPTASSHVRRRGYDQAKLITRLVAAQTGLHYTDCLIRTGQSRQVGASRRQRLEQLQHAYRTTEHKLIKAAHIILIDDVVTTGATLEAAAGALRRAGASRIDAVVFAQP
jgi:ComF family protein